MFKILGTRYQEISVSKVLLPNLNVRSWIAAYLDPFTLDELSVEEIDEAESLITNEAKICGAA
ncbi:unnamed protein product, partial [Didymodactylos carnosus]